MLLHQRLKFFWSCQKRALLSFLFLSIFKLDIIMRGLLASRCHSAKSQERDLLHHHPNPPSLSLAVRFRPVWMERQLWGTLAVPLASWRTSAHGKTCLSYPTLVVLNIKQPRVYGYHRPTLPPGFITSPFLFLFWDSLPSWPWHHCIILLPQFPA